MAVGTFSGVRSLAEIGVAPGNSGSTNTAAFNAAIGTSGDPLRLVGDVAASIPLAGPIRWPVGRSVSLDGRDVTTLAQQTAGQPVIQFHSPGGVNDWNSKRHTIKDAVLTATGGAACVSYDNTGPGGAVRFHRLLLEGLDLWTVPASTAMPGYGIDLVADYSVMPTILRCEAFGGGVLRWIYGPTELHATSILKVEQCRSHVQTAARYAPDYWLDGHRNLKFSQNILEGGWGYAAGVDGVALYDGAVGLLVTNPGPMTTLLDQIWPEHWGTRSNPDWHQWVIRNPWAGGAGAHQPRTTFLMGVGGYGLVKNVSTADQMTVYCEKSPGVTVVTSGSLVTVIERDSHGLWQGDGPAESGSQSESPVQTGRREPAPAPLYVFPGGTGDDGGGLARVPTAEAYPHRHPVHGPCLAVVPGWPPGVFTLPTGRAADGKRVYVRLRVSSPHHVRKGGGAGGLWAKLGTCGREVFRAVPDGFVPADLEWSVLSDAGYPDKLLTVADWYSQPSGGSYGVPASPWLLVYGLSVSYQRPTPLPRAYGPSTSFEWTAGGGPPAGTYSFGDKVLTKNDGLPYVCDQSGTSRSISKTCNTTAGSAVLTWISGVESILEGDYLTLSGVTRGRVLTIAADGAVTLDTTVPATLTGTALTNKSPTFARRRV